MWRQWSLCVLYLLQVIVLSGMLAGYILSPQAPPAHTPQQEKRFEHISPGQGRSSVSKVKPSVKMKAITLSGLKENLPRVMLRLELARLLMTGKDHHLRDLISRSARSVTHLATPQRKLQQVSEHESATEHQVNGDHGLDTINEHEDESVDEHDTWEISIHGDNPHNKDGYPVADETNSDEETEDVDEAFDYPQDESAQDDSAQDDSAQDESTQNASTQDESAQDDSAQDDSAQDESTQNASTQDEPTHDELPQDDLEAFESALHHIEEMNTCSLSRCKHPMPFVQSVRDPHDKGRVFLPECVVLHRCMNYTGCCGGGNHECVPKSMNIITKAFLIIPRHSDHDDQVVFNPSMATTLTFVNHTECECREKPRPLKCTKVCPKPFRLTQEGTLCRCDCFPVALQDNWPCESVKDGVVSLSLAGQTCIRDNNCYHPDCTVGDFDIRSGLCPLSDEYALPAFLFENPNERRLYREHLRSYDFTNSKSKFSQGGDDSTKASTISEYSGRIKDTTDNKEQELLPQQSPLFGSDESSTIQMPIKQSKSITVTPPLTVHGNKNIYKHNGEFSFDNTMLPTELHKQYFFMFTSPASSDKPTDNLKNVLTENVSITNINEHNNSSHNKSNYAGQLNETSQLSNSTFHMSSDKEIHENVTSSERNSNHESAYFGSENNSESTSYNKIQLDSSSESVMSDEPREEDHLTRRRAHENTLRHKYPLSSHTVHEDVYSSATAPTSQTRHELQSDQKSPKSLPQPPQESSTVAPSSSSSLPLSQILSSSSRTTTSSYLQSSLPSPENPRKIVSKQAGSHEHVHSKTSYDQLQLDGLLNYDYYAFDGSGDEFR